MGYKERKRGREERKREVMAEEKQKVGKPMVEKGKVAPEQIEEIEKGEYVTIAQIANELSYTRAWILNLIHQGRIKAIKPLGGNWRVPRSEYERIIKEGIPPMPREPVEKPPVTKIVVDEKKVIDKVVEPEKKGEKPSSIFPFDFTSLGGFFKK